MYIILSLVVKYERNLKQGRLVIYKVKPSACYALPSPPDECTVCTSYSNEL